MLGVTQLANRVLDVSVWPPALGLATYVVVLDLAEYLFHRAQHALPWLWRLHALHHSDPSVNALTTGRHVWGDNLIKALTVWPLVALALHPSPTMIALEAAIGLYHFVVHANLPINLGPPSWLINAPAYHRLHHSRRDAKAIFAALLPIWDVPTGDYRRPATAVETGLPTAPHGILDVLWPPRFA